MAKTLTKAQLAEQLEAAHVSYEKLAAANAAVLAQIAALQRPAAVAKPSGFPSDGVGYNVLARGLTVADATFLAAESDGNASGKWTHPAARDGIKTTRANCSCAKCAGTGWYDQDTGRICFQCEGKGFQTDADQRRNWGYQRTAALVRKATQRPIPTRQPTVATTARANAIAAYFAANPGARSVTPEQLQEFSHAPA